MLLLVKLIKYKDRGNTGCSENNFIIYQNICNHDENVPIQPGDVDDGDPKRPRITLPNGASVPNGTNVSVYCPFFVLSYECI